MRFLHVNFKIFSKISNLNWFFAQTRKNLSLGFFLFLKIIKSFQNSIILALIFIKIRFFKSKFAKIHEKFQNFAVFHCFFAYFFKYFRSLQGAPPREPLTNPYFQNFLKFFLHFRENFDKILKKIQKIAKFPYKFSINYKMCIAILSYLKIFEFAKMRSFDFSNVKKYPHRQPATPPPHPRNPV